jgi:nucleoside-diphosphate-sugar epimerase
MHVVVTGAGGFSGSHIVPALLARGHRVTAVVGRSHGRLDPALQSRDLDVVSGNLNETLPLPSGIDAVVHAAARSPAPGVSDADMAVDNAIATLRLINFAQAARAKTFIYLSSLSIHGTITVAQVDEATPAVSPDVYGLTKYVGEVALRDTKLRSLSIRLPGVLGRNSVRNWMTGVLAKAKANAEIAYYNPDAPFNNAVHVADLCDFIGTLIERTDWDGHLAMPIGAGGMTTVRRAVEIVASGVGSRSALRGHPDPSRTGFTISSQKAQELGYKPMEIEALLARFATENRD